MTFSERVEKVSDLFQKTNVAVPKIVLALGSGMGTLAAEWKISHQFDFSELGIASSTVQGHSGHLLFASIAGVPVACLQGRLHFYEGLPMSEVVFPFRLCAALGSTHFILTNASGGLSAEKSPPYLMLIRDHINLMGTSPLIGSGPEIDEWGERFPDLTHAYDPRLREAVLQIGARIDLPLEEGVYVASHGPAYETPAEVRMARIVGGDIVGMSTVPETIALRQMNKKVLAISCVTNYGAGVVPEQTNLSHQEVIENAEKLKRPLGKLLNECVALIHETETNI